MKKVLILLLMAVMLLSFSLPSLAEGDASLVGGELKVGMVGAPYALNAWISNDLNSALIANILYPSLLVFNENAQKVPYILESYEVSEDLKTWTAKIRGGLSWHDGVKFTAEDLAFTAVYCATHDVNFGSDYYANVDTAEALDELTVKYTLKEPQV
ncbi:MAG: ABC transporter substrate-binding protein, partial [Eubacteriales bacterium]|nr:ABC transporter substrate-binding protein [Eubacteriales bacterium]